MNYKENKKKWKVGDIVIHDADAKEKRMLMKVIDVVMNEQGYNCHTEYLDKSVDKEQYWSEKKYLHSPKKFKIDV